MITLFMSLYYFHLSLFYRPRHGCVLLYITFCVLKLMNYLELVVFLCHNSPYCFRLVNNSNFGWRGLRLLACRSPHFFTHSASPIATLPEYLTTMIKKLAKELPVSWFYYATSKLGVRRIDSLSSLDKVEPV